MATIRRKILRAFYPLLMKIMQWTGRNRTVLQNKTAKLFKTPIYALSVVLNNGKRVGLDEWKGKKLLFVNTASDCGYTGQYSELQQLQQQYGNRLQVIGFPANDFKEQERSSDAAIAQFCQTNFGITFPLAQRSRVGNGASQHPVYQWLTKKEKNGWNDKAPSWNFSKYLVDEQGVLTHYFDPAISPLSQEMIQAIET